MIVSVEELMDINTDAERQQWLLDNGLTMDEIDAVIEFNNEMELV